ncbi:putative pentatricopeptide repeat-containing protein At5g52630 [Cynara cardunculus var. scolymus]|uniref:putative pentatricopeptide repeat-containing protein At5g52630 n=1 Tax=Cynara cardunculus var. scolymus TaxID=59895 RepID=UPI000D62BFC0|nr:putative pentatricopeptide repeat-containing protein At5g52630 [Cynara cardunculus var. scolymus]
MISSFTDSCRPLSIYFIRRLLSTQQKYLSRKLPPYENPDVSYMELSQKFYELMKSCVSIRSTHLARGLHCQLITIGLDSSTFMRNNLINMYAGCGLVDDASLVFNEIELKNVFSWNTMIEGFIDSGRLLAAERVFEEMPERDVVSWNSMMSGYFRNGFPEKTVEVFVSLVRCFDCVPGAYSFTCMMKACASLKIFNLALQVHGFAEKLGFLGDDSVESSMVDMYIKSGAPDFAERVFLKMLNPNMFSCNSMLYGYSKLYGAQRALELFDEMPKRDVVSWNMIISILSKHGDVAKTLGMFIEMCCQGFRPNSMTYASVLSACTSIYELSWGVHLHGRIIRMQSNIDVYVGSSLIDMYAKCGCFRKARQVFNDLKEHNVVSWTSMIGGAAHCGKEEEAISLFKQMKAVSVASDQFTLATVLNASYGLQDIYLGSQIHAYSIRIGIDHLTSVANALVTMYAKCGDIESVNRAFNWMSHKDIISWTTMITAFSHNGNVGKARECFDKMPERNVVSWNSMLATYIQHGFWEEGLKVYVLMRKEGVKPDCVTFVTSISACAYAAILKLGNQIVAQAEKFGFGSDVSVKNSIVTMYSKCGRIGEACKTFDSILAKNLISWNAMMAGYAQSGQGNQVIDTFEQMIRSGIMPDNISYVSVLSGCSHSGLVPEGHYYFDMLLKDQDISPTCEHFACMVDLLGRAGRVEEAKDLIDKMLIKPNAAVWGALLGACRIHGKATLAETALKNLVVLDAEDSGSYVLLANLYSDSGKLESVSNVRRIMKDKGIRKNPGCSWIEVDNRVHVFTVDDTNHPRINDVYRILGEIIGKIEETGIYIKENGSVNKPRAYHSEKLALAFGLMTLPAWMPIHIMKNLRICDDCHLVMKLASLVTSRELIVRDANRFHHFQEGACSCRDYW